MPVREHGPSPDHGRPLELVPAPGFATAPLSGHEGLRAGDGPPLGGLPLEGRELVVQARLSNLLASLGELPAGGGLRELPAPGLARVVDAACPGGAIAVHGRRLVLPSLELEHLVVTARGVVVIGPDWAVPAEASAPSSRSPRRCRGANRAPSASAGGSVVRQTLRRANGLRVWLAVTPWAWCPVLAAVCTPPVASAQASPPVFLDKLWIGSADRLPGLLASGSDLSLASRAALGSFLRERLPQA